MCICFRYKKSDFPNKNKKTPRNFSTGFLFYFWVKKLDMGTRYFIFTLSAVALASTLLFTLAYVLSPIITKSLDIYPMGVTPFDPSHIQDSKIRDLVTLDNHHSKLLSAYARIIWVVQVLTIEIAIYTNLLSHKNQRPKK